mmetsp:Transcript_1160/g.2831  ORF Transcript_1160/g.2831 Transcript_1160/m.2831 type:complete len:309 (-) Transcript_1160:276-1202(-)
MASVPVVPLWVCGVATQLLSLSLASFGQTLQRYSHRAKSSQALLKGGGISLFVVSGPISMTSYLWAPISSITVLGALRSPLLAILALWFLGEKIDGKCWHGICLSVAGSWFGVLSAPKEKLHPLSNPMEFYTPAVVAYLSAVVPSYLVMLVVVMRSMKFKQMIWTIPFLSAVSFNVQVLYSDVVGRLSLTGFEGPRFWSQPSAVFVVFVIAATALLQLQLSVVGVDHHPPHRLIPVANGLSAAITFVQSVFVVHEFENISNWRAVGWALSALLGIWGSALVARSGEEHGASPSKAEPLLGTSEVDVRC